MKTINTDNVGFLCFDFDGVILDTIEMKKYAFTQIYEQLNKSQIAYIEQFQMKNGGVDRFEKFIHFERKLFGKEISRKKLELLSSRLSEIIIKNIADCDFIGGVMEFISSAREQRLLCGVASAMPCTELELILKKFQIRDEFQFVSGMPTPKKEQLLFWQQRFAAPGKKGLYFGDTLKDFEAADCAGFDFIGIGNNQDFNDRSIPAVQDFKYLKLTISNKVA